MSSGDLQEMEVGTKQSKTAVNAGAKPGLTLWIRPSLVPTKISVVLPPRTTDQMTIQQSKTPGSTPRLRQRRC